MDTRLSMTIFDASGEKVFCEEMREEARLSVNNSVNLVGILPWFLAFEKEGITT